VTNNLLILGAGVDRTTGIDFPLANTLLTDITRYLDGEGKGVDAALRTMIPNLRFSFNNMIARAVDQITSRETHQQKAMVERVRQAIKDLPDDQVLVRKHGELIIKLFEKLATIAEHSILDADMEQLIRDVFPKDAHELIDSDSILDIHSLSLSDTFKAVLKRTLRMGLDGAHHPVAQALGSDMLNIETLLVEKFLGFYNEKLSDIKSYLYIAWALWAYLVHRQNAVLKDQGSTGLPFYGSIPSDVKAITLNYTAFLELQVGVSNAIYFHGGLSDYVRMDTRDLLPIEQISGCDPEAFIRDVVTPNVDLRGDDCTRQKHVIPAMVPPLRLKPILSHRYIELWATAAEWIEQAKRIVVVGYSFNNADEHFNDIIRQCRDCKIDIVVPEARSDAFLGRMEKVFRFAKDQYNTVQVQGITSLQAHNVRLIPARAADIDLEKLLEV
jgi:hypothetical protein